MTQLRPDTVDKIASILQNESVTLFGSANLKLDIMKNFVKAMAKCNSSSFNLTIFMTSFLISGKPN